MTRLGNGHQAACWLLENPVHTYPGSREKPRQLLRRTAEYFASTCDADPAYAGTLFRNVGLARRESGFVVEGTDRQWPLLELAESIPFGWRVPSRKKLRTAVGRNVSLFELLMREAGREHVAAESDPDARLGSERGLRLAPRLAGGRLHRPIGAPLPGSVAGGRMARPALSDAPGGQGAAGREGQRPPPLEGREGRSDGSSGRIRAGDRGPAPNGIVWGRQLSTNFTGRPRDWDRPDSRIGGSGAVMWRDGRGCGADREGGSQPQHGHHPPCCGYETADVAARRMSGRRWEGRTPRSARQTYAHDARRAVPEVLQARSREAREREAQRMIRTPPQPPQRGPDRGGGFER